MKSNIVNCGLGITVKRRSAAELLKLIVTRYENLQQTDGASHVMDASGTFTAGHWVGSSLESLIVEAKALLAK